MRCCAGSRPAGASPRKAAQLSLLGGVADALTRKANVDVALRDVLAATLDAAGISKGALILKDATGALALRQDVGFSGYERTRLRDLFGHRALFAEIVRRGASVSIPSPAASEASLTIMADANVSSMQIVPLISDGIGVGVLIIGATRTDVTSDDSVTFARAMANQIAHSLALVESVKRLTASEERYRTLLNSAQDAIAVTTPDGIVCEVNQRWVKILGRPAEELTGLHIRDLAGAGREPAGVETTDDVLVTGRSNRSPVVIVKPDASRVIMEFSSTTLDIANERLVLTIGRDVTERTRAEDHLRMNERLLQESEDRLRLATDSTEVGVFDYLPQNGRLTWSEFTKRHFGIRSGVDVTYELFLTGLHPDDRVRLDGVVGQASCSEHAGQYAIEFRTLGIEDAQERHIAARGRVFFDDDQRPIRIVGTTIDITDRKRAEDATREAGRQKDEFLAMLAHELRNPLAPIRPALRLLQDRPGCDPTADRAIEVIERQVIHLARLVDDLLDVSRTTLNKIQLRTQYVTLDKVIDDALEAVTPLAAAAGRSLNIQRPTAPVWLNADPVRLVQVFSNLINNAIKFTSPDGHVDIAVEQHDNAATIRVVDDGVGFGEEFQAHIFRMYSQEDRRLERAAGGLGVGLALAKALVLLHGGRIDASSGGRDRGAEFLVTLPVVAAPQPAKEPVAGDATVAQTGRPLRVLVVDDNADGANMLRTFVSTMGHETAIAFDGPSGLAQAKAFRPDLILLDIGLPGMNGYEVALSVRQESALREVYLAAVTGWGTDEDQSRARAAGFDVHLTKPADLDVIEHLTSTLAHTVNCHGCDRCLKTAH